MLERSSLVIRGRGEHTKRRQQIDILLKKAMKGDRRAKLKVYKEFGIRLYSPQEVDKYVKERLSQEYNLDGKNTNNGPTAVTRKTELKALPKNGARQSRNTNSLSRTKSRGKAKQLLKRT